MIECASLKDVDTGYYNYKQNYLGVLKNDKMYKINLFTNKVEKKILYSAIFLD